MADDDAFFKQDVQRLQRGNQLLDDIERKLKGYLTTASDLQPQFSLSPGEDRRPVNRGADTTAKDPFADFSSPFGASSEIRPRAVADHGQRAANIRHYRDDSLDTGVSKKADFADERKPESLINGLDDRIKTIEEKIQKFKAENESFEKKEARDELHGEIRETKPRPDYRLERDQRRCKLV